MKAKTKKKKNHLPDSLFRKLTETANDAVYLVDVDGKILFWNKKAEKITGFSNKELHGKYCYDTPLMHFSKAGCVLCHTKNCIRRRTLRTNKPQSRRYYVVKKGGSRIPVDVHSSVIEDNGKAIGCVKIFRDASLYERGEMERVRERRLSFLDQLTNVPNRRGINERLKMELERVDRYGSKTFVSVIDIDNFKKINDKFGHDAGDKVLKEVAYMYGKNLRRNDFIGRLGGDEFVIILTNTDHNNAKIAMNRIKEIIPKAYITNNKTAIIDKKTPLTASIGIAKIKPSDTLESIFKRADTAMYKAKKSKRYKIKFA